MGDLHSAHEPANHRSHVWAHDRQELGRHANAGAREKIAQMVWEILIQAGIVVQPLKCPDNNIVSYWNSIQKIAFAGNDCAVLAYDKCWKRLLDLVMPEKASTALRALAGTSRSWS